MLPAWLIGLIIPVGLGGSLGGRRLDRPDAGPADAAAVAAGRSTAVALPRRGELQTHVAATMTRVLIGFAIGAAAGTLLGMLTGASRGWRVSCSIPSIQGLRAIPSLAWVPIFILWLGIFETSKLALIALGVFFPVYLGMLSAIQRWTAS